MQQALILTVLGMGTVFVVLYLINLMIVLMSRLVALKNKVPQQPADQPVKAETADTDEENIAVAIASVIAYLGVQPNSSGKAACRYHIRTPIAQGVPATWLTAAPSIVASTANQQKFKPLLRVKPVLGLRQ